MLLYSSMCLHWPLTDHRCLIKGMIFTIIFLIFIILHILLPVCLRSHSISREINSSVLTLRYVLLIYDVYQAWKFPTLHFWVPVQKCHIFPICPGFVQIYWESYSWERMRKIEKDIRDCRPKQCVDKDRKLPANCDSVTLEFMFFGLTISW